MPQSSSSASSAGGRTTGGSPSSLSANSGSDPKQIALPDEIIREIRSLHFETRRHVDEGVVGRYRSAFRGTGMEFEEVREYLPGDDIRRIDWKVTARSGRPFVKSYREERELVVMLAVDLSASTRTGTRVQTRAEQLARVGAALTLIALKNNDKVGLVTFSDRIESYHPPRKARSAVWRILHEVLAEQENPALQTRFDVLLPFLQNVLKRRSIIFLLTDGLGTIPETLLAPLAGRHEVILALVRDPADFALPDAGLVRFTDPESGESCLIDTSHPKVRTRYAELAQQHVQLLKGLCVRRGIESFEIRTDQAFGPALRMYFDRRAHRGSRR